MKRPLTMQRRHFEMIAKVLREQRPRVLMWAGGLEGPVPPTPEARREE